MDKSWTGRNFGEFYEFWKSLPLSNRQAFVDSNGVATAWVGDQMRFGDFPGRSFSFERVFLILATPEEKKLYRRRIEDRLRKDSELVGEVLKTLYL